MPFFSIIIPLYNKEDYISDTLKSVFNQNFQDFEVIIIDDGSTDKSLEIAKLVKDSRITIIQQKNKGVSSARNKGIQKAKAKYIALLDADDTWHNIHLFELKKLIKTFPNAGLYCNNYEILYSNNIYAKTSFNFSFKTDSLIVEDYFKASIINAIALTSAVGFSKETFNKIGGFNPALEIAEDLDLWVRFALNYYVCFNPKITMTYNKGVSDSLSKKELNDIKYRFINNHHKQEQKNSSLKLYLDINRYAVALRCKINNEIILYKKIKSEIDFDNLNFKQKALINCPIFVLKGIKLFQHFLIKNNIYLTANK
ncbi:glycosyltransferase [Thalassobellus suaedae]|uniref:Glycosyltransferase n=1 Tax=Thalassobellus suaedae TaxID=3074124 RepID=A0ABY9Y4J5_9FLAO|nr:glycosyltransferase [Flavobacteriaceae bacterium HL-DH10]